MQEATNLYESGHGVISGRSGISIFCQLLWGATGSKESSRLGPIVEHTEADLLVVAIVQSSKVHLAHGRPLAVHHFKGAGHDCRSAIDPHWLCLILGIDADLACAVTHRFCEKCRAAGTCEWVRARWFDLLGPGCM